MTLTRRTVTRNVTRDRYTTRQRYITAINHTNLGTRNKHAHCGPLITICGGLEMFNAEEVLMKWLISAY